jgi:hypothetical protein
MLLKMVGEINLDDKDLIKFKTLYNQFLLKV